ncbi:aldose 1-epimerase family protein [Lactobacillus crispatus]|uniref:Aldose 1-epimerase family protein n=1 Tax=Lactobacillus crispatus TaxID=47770 RepID=A0A5M9YML9_9LACO|nr:aldose 1-epimerase family protein [Lactobacillus crispatus]KAA8807700.1 aldose 1-epimerase family protein [Lactobacillus crispatus]KAA8811814.1 aldose 1-epimerase family protein [Lactobacillus crispatus]KRK32385.1 aldose 1-epimerase [Lactobacillus crispatus DSM 20584 = JCM 1185 = ATCC 33820]MBM6872305.1 aldose 1-epimerase family protein [Lactobacillus crispatus]MBW9143771.1 aldose 1-epimerase family protein [Lactobacillus crispatus]
MDYTIKNNIIEVVISDHGAEVQSVKGAHTGEEYMWQADPEIWGRHAPVLFPIVGRLKNDEYKYQGKTYHMGQHGFARDCDFEVENHTQESITFLLKDNEKTREMYPFKFEFRVNYNLMNNLLEENFSVVNKSDETMIFGVGGHPGFNLPVNNGEEKEDYYFDMHPSIARVKIPLKGAYLDWNNRSLASTDSFIGLSDELFKDDALIYELHGHDNKVSLRTDKSKFHINVWTRNAPYVGIWSQYPKTANYVCIEPWWGIADREDADGELEHKYGMNHLEPGKEYQAGFSITYHSASDPE